MKFKIATPTLKTALDRVNHATANISTTPILENILIKVHFKDITLTANNLEMAIEHIITENITIESEGSFCVPSKIFTNFIWLLDDDFVHIELIWDGALQIISETSNIKIKGNPASDFPIIPAIKEKSHLTLPSSTLKKAIEKTLFSAAEGNIRPTLAGIFINIDGKIAKFATTDSFRMSEYKTALSSDIQGSFSQIIPSRTAFELKSLLEEKQDIKIIVGDNQIGFFFWNTKFYSRLLNGKFPDYEAFFPNHFNTKTILNRFDLISGLKKINLLSRENNYSIKMSLSNETGILIETSQTQSGEARVNIIGTIEWEEAIIGLNSEYFLEALGAIETTHVAISFESPLSPILITGISEADESVDLRHIIMPLKI